MLDADQIDAILARTLDDARVSRGERKMLGSYFDEIAADPSDLTLWRSRAFALARRAMDEGRGPEVLDWLEGVEKVLAHRASASIGEPPEAAAYFTPGDECPRAIAGHLDRARSSVDICVFTITDDRITGPLIAGHRRGLAVRVITDNDKALDLGSDIQEIRQAGVPLRTDRDANHMHHKFAVFDRSVLMTGSYNWTRSAAEHNCENLLTTADPRLVAAYLKEFERLWQFLD